MEKAIFIEYAEIARSIRDLEERKEVLNEKIVAEMNENKLDQVKSDYGTFSFVERKTWKYSEKVVKKEEEVKKLKKNEEISGIAKAEVKNSLRFQLTK